MFSHIRRFLVCLATFMGLIPRPTLEEGTPLVTQENPTKSWFRLPWSARSDDLHTKAEKIRPQLDKLRGQHTEAITELARINARIAYLTENAKSIRKGQKKLDDTTKARLSGVLSDLGAAHAEREQCNGHISMLSQSIREWTQKLGVVQSANRMNRVLVTRHELHQMVSPEEVETLVEKTSHYADEIAGSSNDADGVSSGLYGPQEDVDLMYNSMVGSDDDDVEVATQSDRDLAGAPAAPVRAIPVATRREPQVVDDTTDWLV